jgi:hypothetical protein
MSGMEKTKKPVLLTIGLLAALLILWIDVSQLLTSREVEETQGSVATSTESIVEKEVAGKEVNEPSSQMDSQINIPEQEESSEQGEDIITVNISSPAAGQKNRLKDSVKIAWTARGNIQPSSKILFILVSADTPRNPDGSLHVEQENAFGTTDALIADGEATINLGDYSTARPGNAILLADCINTSCEVTPITFELY